MKHSEAPSEVIHFSRGEQCQERGNLQGAAACLEKALELNYRIKSPDSADRGMAHDIRRRLGEDIYPELEREYRECGDNGSAEYFRLRGAMYRSPVEEGSTSIAEVINLETGEVIG